MACMQHKRGLGSCPYPTVLMVPIAAPASQLASQELAQHGTEQQAKRKLWTLHCQH